jgi:hypothetical protein
MTATTTGLTTSQVQSLIQQTLIQHRNALNNIISLYAWTSGLATADMQAAAGLSAVADAHAEAILHSTGLPPDTYPQPASSYPYAASQSQVIGPQ